MYQFPVVRRQENSSFANLGCVLAGAVCKCAVSCVDCFPFSVFCSKNLAIFGFFRLVANVSKIHAGREFPDELPTKNCISKFQFPVNEATKPDLYCCYSHAFIICLWYKLSTDCQNHNSFDY